MASQYFGYDRGADLSPDKVTTGAATGSKDVELRVDLTKNLTRQDIVLIVEAIERVIEDQRITTLTL